MDTFKKYVSVLDHILDGSEEEYAAAYGAGNTAFAHTVVTALDAYEHAGYGLRQKMGYFTPVNGGTLHVQLYLPTSVDPAETCVELTFTSY